MGQYTIGEDNKHEEKKKHTEDAHFYQKNVRQAAPRLKPSGRSMVLGMLTALLCILVIMPIFLDYIDEYLPIFIVELVLLIFVETLFFISLHKDDRMAKRQMGAWGKNEDKWGKPVPEIKSSGGTPGYYSENFYCDKGVIYISKGESSVVTVYSNQGDKVICCGSGDENTNRYVTRQYLDDKFTDKRIRFMITGKEKGATTIKVYREDDPSIGFEIAVTVVE